MKKNVSFEKIYIPSEDIVAREIQGEFIIIPIASGIADMEDELFSLNETGMAVWKKLDGKRKLNDIAKDLSSEFESSYDEVKKDVLGLMEQLVNRKMVIEVSKN